MEKNSLTVRDLVTHFFTYAGLVQALGGVSFYVKENETLGLVGETGCGKSVTALSVMRLVPPPGKIVAGEILYKGKNLLNKTEKEMRDIRGPEISMIFQDPTRCLNPVLKAGYQIAEPFIYHRKLKKSEVKKEAIKLMKQLGLSDTSRLYESYPHELSGGMRQRIMLAIALSLHPSILICDEPTTNLDVTIQAEILDFINQLQKRYKMAIIWITHNLGVTAQICQRIAVMYAGTIVECADVSSIMLEPMHPYTRMLLNCVPGLHKKEKLPVIPGTIPNLINPPTGCRFHPRCPYAMDVCKTKKPPQIEIGHEHSISCWLYGDMD